MNAGPRMRRMLGCTGPATCSRWPGRAPRRRSPRSRGRRAVRRRASSARRRRFPATTTGPTGRRSASRSRVSPRPTPRTGSAPSSSTSAGRARTAVEYLEAFGHDLFPAFARRFDIVAMDPRGVGQSTPSIDCQANQETEGLYSQPFTTPFNLDRQALIDKVTRVHRQVRAQRRTSCGTSPRPTWRATSMPSAGSLGEQQITFLRLLLRHAGRRDLRPAVPQPPPRAGARRARRRGGAT